jgi:ribosomal protein S18 acetylase RimI-like enzyme
VGLIAGIPVEGGDQCTREIITRWIAPQFRGRGVAEELVSAVFAWARESGATSIVLNVSEENKRARRFYERIAFVATAERKPLRSNPAVTALAMRLALPRPDEK